MSQPDAITEATDVGPLAGRIGIDTGDLVDPDRAHVEALLCLMGTRQPSLQQIWAVMDFVWHDMGGDKWNPEPEMLRRYYQHPVWTLNGLFIEQHPLSLDNREVFSDWVRDQQPSRVGDFGGGFGTLARMVAAKCPKTAVEVIEPFPHALAATRLASFPHASYRSELTGSYDVILATDVFEHVIDPLGLASAVSAHIPVGGRLMTANHFAPSIACHLPATFHFRATWHLFMAMLGYRAESPVGYGWSYLRVRETADINVIRKWERASRASFRCRRRMHFLDRFVDRLSLRWASRTAGR